MLEKELLDAIIETCDIMEDIPEDLSPEDPLFDAPLIGPDSILGLDSLDAVEIVVMIQDKYGIRIQGKDQGQQILLSLRTLANYVETFTSPSQSVLRVPGTNSKNINP
jgi:acyl carrier protein